MFYSKETHTYKILHDCTLQADVYRTPESCRKPCIIWIHGGGLIFGSRTMLPEEQVTFYLTAGYTVIAIDYRLAPETKLVDIIEDVLDACRWVHRQGPDLFYIDPEKIVVVGHSSGGYLALMAGLHAHPRPKAVVSFYGYGNITESWCNTPCPHYSKDVLVSEEIAYAGIENHAIAGSNFTGFTDKRWLFYLFCRQQGRWAQELVGTTNSILSHTFCPIHHITERYPSTFLVHGDQDVDVPVLLSHQMAHTLQKHQVTHELLIMEKMGHIFDLVPDVQRAGAPARFNHPDVVSAFSKIALFLQKQLS